MRIHETKRKTLDYIINDLKQIENIAAIVLGGSHCIGMAEENSDLDIGLYYHELAPFDIEHIRFVARKYNIDDTLTVTNFYQWGTWVNGGAWINTISGEVDFVYRNIEQVKSTIKKSITGIWENDFEQQPPFGFSSVIYLAETKFCYPLYDPHGIIREMKNDVENYPLKLKQTIVQQSLWSAQFTLWQAEKFVAKRDIYNLMGCFTRILKKMTDALFALNETYALGDKRAIQIITNMPKRPDKLEKYVEEILAIKNDDMYTSFEKIKNLFEQVVSLADRMYHPYFKL